MPVRRELRGKNGPYGREWRTVIRPRILRRAGGVFVRGRYLGGAKCEQCGVPDHLLVIRAAGWWFDGKIALPGDARLAGPGSGFRTMAAAGFPSGFWVDPLGRVTDYPLESFPRISRRWVTIVLAVAHLNHDPYDNRDENLAALCQWCHLHYDKEHHREVRRIRKDALRPVLAAAGGGA